MAYNNIQPAAFIPATDQFYATHYALSFPRSWREPILGLYRNRYPRAKQVPISRLNQVIAAVAPDLISVAKKAPLDDTQPWLYTSNPYPPAVMMNFIHAWLRDLHPSPEAHSLVKEAARELKIGSLEWDLLSVDMLEHTVSDGGTIKPASHLWQLLPETFAARIARLAPYEHFGEKLTFRQIAQPAGAAGAELVSWPPLDYASGRGEKSKHWKYSAYIRLSLRTVPFSPVPRINISTGVRRWVRDKVWMPARGSVSVYMLADESFVPDGPSPERFAVGRLGWNPRTGGNEWLQGGPEGLLLRVSALTNLPSAELMVKEPETWLNGRDGVTAAVLHHTMMTTHGVRSGIMPSERRRLTEWAAQALEPEFAASPELRRSRLQPQVPHKLLQDNASVKKDATAEEAAEVALRNTEIAKENAAKRRELVAAAVGQGGLNAVLLNQSDIMRDHLIQAAETSLGLAEHRKQAGPHVWSWEHPELTVRLHVRALGALGDRLGGTTAPRRGKDWDAAILERRTAVHHTVRDWMRDATGPAPVAFVELEGRKAFKRTADPKYAIRLGCVDAGLVSQFLEVPGTSKSEEDDDSAPHRAPAAWADGLRQLGMRFLPEHSVGEHIPADLNQVAFWLVKRRVSGDNQHSQFTPIAILVRSGQSCVMGRTPQMQEWVPYPELLKNLTGQIRPDDLNSRDRQEEVTAQFIQQTLYKLRGEPTLVLTHAQNTRERWPWLTNSGLVPDKIRLGKGPLQRLASQGRQLRIVRIAGSARNETPQWWAPDKSSAGISKGLWVPEAEQGRVFYSTSDKASQHKVGRDVSKFTEHRNGDGPSQRRPNKPAWNPELLELAMVALQPGDEAEQWAMLLHQQRFADDYTDALGLPLVLHLASLTHAYALPHEDPEQAEPGAATIGDTPEQLELDWDDTAE
jgi:pPIWI_RE module N-terminal domain/RNaseH domain of pPIWI_RE/MID domain of pPIWI_RE